MEALKLLPQSLPQSDEAFFNIIDLVCSSKLADNSGSRIKPHMWWRRIAQSWSSCEHIALQTQHSIPVAEISRLPHGSHQSVNSLGLPLAVNAHGLLHGHGNHLLKQVLSEKIETGKWF